MFSTLIHRLRDRAGSGGSTLDQERSMEERSLLYAAASGPKLSNPADFGEVGFHLAKKAIRPYLRASKPTVAHFRTHYNGRGWRAFILGHLLESRLDLERSIDLLDSIVEDALIAVGSHLTQDGHISVRLDAQGEFILATAIAERLPRIPSPDEELSLATRLIGDLKTVLGQTHALAIDDGAVYMVGAQIEIGQLGPDPVRFC